MLSNQINKLSNEVRQQITANQHLFQRLLERELKKSNYLLPILVNIPKELENCSLFFKEKEEQAKVVPVEPKNDEIPEKEIVEENEKKLFHVTSTKESIPEAPVPDLPIVPDPEKVIEKEPDLKDEKLRHIATRKTLADGSPIIAVLVFSCNRLTVQRCLDQLIKLRPSAEQFPIIVSQDCEHKQTADVIKSYGDEVVHIQVKYFLYNLN